MKLHISAELSLPLDTATQTIAILARKRVGKTYTASVLAEELIEAEIPIVVLDPTGAWWGLRSSADGKKEGYPVIIIGGEHGDLPLEQSAGKLIADLVVDHPGYYVIDFSRFEFDAEIRRFATDFGKRFYYRKEEKRFPMQLIIDEADMVAPQHPQKDQTVMLHTYDNIVRRGGIRGIGVTMISQRPAVLNKNILTQCETLIQLQMTGSQDVDAVDHWTRIHGTEKERKEFLSTIATLQRGEAWIWSPSWLQMFRKVNIRERRTFNSSATPKAGEKVIVPQKLAAIDLAKLGDQIKATAERAKDNDPAELRKQLSEARHQLRQMEGRVTKSPPEIKPVPVPVLTAQELKEWADVIRVGVSTYTRAANELLAKLEQTHAKFPGLSHTQKAWTPNPAPKPAVKPTAEIKGNGKLGKAERKILNTLAHYPDGASKKKVAIFAGYALGGGGFNNAVGALRSAGYVTEGEPLTLTEEGRAVAGDVAPLPIGQELYNLWMAHPHLGAAEREILRVLFEARTPMPKDGIAANTISAKGTPYEPDGGGFNNAIGRLRSLELVTGRGDFELAEEFYAD